MDAKRFGGGVCSQLVGVAVIVVIGAVWGCSSGPRMDADPLTAAREPRYAVSQRAAMVERAWADARAGKTNRSAVRGDLKDIAWSVDLPDAVRLAAVRAVLADDSAGAEADSKAMVGLMLPREPKAGVADELSQTAGARGWSEVTAALVRSLSRPREGVADRARAEFKALQRLHPDRRPEDLVLGVFLEPGVKDASATAVVSADRVRADAWDLLRRLDADGTTRAEFILTLQSGAGKESESLAVMRRGLRELRVVTLSGDEYLWLARLAREDNSANKLWWGQVAGIVAGLESQRVGKLEIRHLEPIRWASVARPELLAATRQELLDQMRSRLNGRTVHTRSRADKETRAAVPERLEAWADRLSWGDLIALRCVDEALSDAGVASALLQQRELDMADTRAEYGGLLRCDQDAGDGRPRAGFAAVLYPPREGERRGDAEFVTPLDMLEQSDVALAHYHFHAQSVRNDRFAGPSPKDLSYAGRFGRTCVVFTSLGENALNADYFQPDGVVIDLGVVSAGGLAPKRARR